LPEAERRYIAASEAMARRTINAEHDFGRQRDLSVSHNKIGDVRRALGDLAGALESYEADLAIAERLAAADPGNSEWQRDLSVSHDKIGNVRVAQGNLAGAFESYEASLAIRERLAAADPGNSEWQRDLIVSHQKLAMAGRSPVEHYGAALGIARDLESSGRLAPVDQWFVADLEKLLAEAMVGGAK
jgi:tetratricopeptide (TPR) repeat protein